MGSEARVSMTSVLNFHIGSIIPNILRSQGKMTSGLDNLGLTLFKQAKKEGNFDKTLYSIQYVEFPLYYIHYN